MSIREIAEEAAFEATMVRDGPFAWTAEGIDLDQATNIIEQAILKALELEQERKR